MMKYMNKVYYPAIFTQEEAGFSVRFPDLPGCFTEGDTIEEANKMAISAIALYTQKEDGSFDFPKVNKSVDFELSKNEFLMTIEFNLAEYLKNK